MALQILPVAFWANVSFDCVKTFMKNSFTVSIKGAFVEV